MWMPESAKEVGWEPGAQKKKDAITELLKNQFTP